MAGGMASWPVSWLFQAGGKCMIVPALKVWTAPYLHILRPGRWVMVMTDPLFISEFDIWNEWSWQPNGSCCSLCLTPGCGEQSFSKRRCIGAMSLMSFFFSHHTFTSNFLSILFILIFSSPISLFLRFFLLIQLLFKFLSLHLFLFPWLISSVCHCSSPSFYCLHLRCWWALKPSFLITLDMNNGYLLIN